MTDYRPPEDLTDRLRRLARFLPRFADPGFEFGTWAGGDRNEDGSITMPWFDFGVDARELIGLLPVTAFDWTAWMETDEGRWLREDIAHVAQASADQLAKLSTALVRADRFSEGTLAWAFESGLLRAIVSRAAALTS